jgi:hypothetical protein
MSLIKRGKYFHFDFQIAGEQYRGPTKCTTRSAARTYEESVKAQVRNGTYGKLHAERDRAERTLGAAIRGYFQGREHQQSLKSGKRYTRVLVEIVGEHALFLEFDHYKVLKIRDAVAGLNVESRYAGCVRGDVQRKKPDGDPALNQRNKKLPRISEATVNRYMEFLRRVILWACANWKQPTPDVNWIKRRGDLCFGME